MYLLDTNIFITAKIQLPMDIYPSFWKALAQCAQNGNFRSIKKVELEIKRGNDVLVDWIDNNLPKDFFISENSSTIASLATVTGWTMSNGVYSPAAKNEFASVADSWLVAEAISQSSIVITHETPDPRCVRRVKIPDVCNAVGVQYCDLNDAFRELHITI